MFTFRLLNPLVRISNENFIKSSKVKFFFHNFNSSRGISSDLVKNNLNKSKKRRIISSDEESSPIKTQTNKRSLSNTGEVIEKTPPKVNGKEKKKSPSSDERKKKSPKDDKIKKSPTTSKISPKTSDKIKVESKDKNESTTESKPKADLSPSEKKVEVKTENKTPVKTINPFFTNAKNVKLQNAGDGLKGADYNPGKKNYHPIDDAFWKKDEKVPYLALAKTFEAIEEISARLRMIEILSNFFRSVFILSPSDLVACVYLSLNQLAPAYEGLELGVAETTLMKAIAQSTGRTLQQIKTDAQNTGDLGIVAEQSRSNQRVMFTPAPHTVTGVFLKLKEIAKMTGTSAMSKKVDKIQSMFVACRHSEARFIIRSLAGKLRIGLAEQSLLQALAQACVMTPPNQKDFPPKILNGLKNLGESGFKSKLDEVALILKETYCQCPNYDQIIPVLLEDGVEKLLEKCEMNPGTPLKPMLAHPTKGTSEVFSRFDGIKFTCEWKYDGERAQVRFIIFHY